MCGRYLFTESPHVVAENFLLSETPAITPKYNVAPSQLVAVIGENATGRRRLVLMQWGFVPSWANDPRKGPRPINARTETAATTAPFKDSFRFRRCVVPASGFYEWLTDGKHKRPHLFKPKTSGPLAFAGLWDTWGTGPGKLFTCAILTVAANETVRPFHDRMPAILAPEHVGGWINPATPFDHLQEFLTPAPEGLLSVVEVSPAVNSPRNDGPECLVPVAASAA